MKVTVAKLHQWKQTERPIAMLTATDYAIARLLDEAGIDILLVGDSLGMVALGYESTLPLTLEDMLHHTQAVCRGVSRAMVVVDLPFLSYQESPQQAIHSAGRVLKETQATAVKLEGGYPAMAETVKRLVETGIPVMGHVGLTPQSVRQMGYQQQGKTPEQRDRILQEALALENAGAFAVVAEHIRPELAREITQKLSIPTIGIGAGQTCDGQVLVTHDMLGFTDKQPPFVKTYANLRETILEAARQYGAEVRSRTLPQSQDS